MLRARARLTDASAAAAVGFGDVGGTERAWGGAKWLGGGVEVQLCRDRGGGDEDENEVWENEQEGDKALKDNLK